MKVSKVTRDQAALICAIAASGGVWDEICNTYTCVYGIIARDEDLSNAASSLAIAAWRYVLDHGPCKVWSRETDAEAEALLRTGWSP